MVDIKRSIEIECAEINLKKRTCQERIDYIQNKMYKTIGVLKEENVKLEKQNKKLRKIIEHFIRS